MSVICSIPTASPTLDASGMLLLVIFWTSFQNAVKLLFFNAFAKASALIISFVRSTISKSILKLKSTHSHFNMSMITSRSTGSFPLQIALSSFLIYMYVCVCVCVFCYRCGLMQQFKYFTQWVLGSVHTLPMPATINSTITAISK